MKYPSFILCMLLLFSCTDLSQNYSTSKIHQFNFKADIDEVSIIDTKAVGENVIRLKWETGDKISVVNITTGMALGGSLTVDAEGYSDIFSGTITGTINPGDVLAFIYPCQKYASETAFTPIDIDYSVQETKNPKLAMIAHHTATGSGSFTNFSVNFAFQMSFLRMNLSELPVSTTFSEVKINGLNDKLTFSISDGSMVSNTSSDKGYIKYTVPSVSDNRGSITVTMGILATESKNRTAVATTASSSFTAYFSNAQLKTNKSYNHNSVGYVNTVMTFKDAAVKAKCIEMFDQNGDGKLSFAEAAAVQDLGVALTKAAGDNPFPKSILHFAELQFFTGLASLPSFSNGYNMLKTVAIPPQITSIANNTFKNCTSLESVIFTSTVPPTLGTDVFTNCDSDLAIYVPHESVAAYKTAFSAYSDDIYDINDVGVDFGLEGWSDGGNIGGTAN